MTFPKAILVLLAVFFGTISSPVNAQINLKTGYSISFLRDDAVDRAVLSFNEARDYLKEFKDLTWLHGFEAGLRFKSGIHAFEVSYLGGYKRLRANFTNPSGGDDLTDKIKFDVHGAGVGYQLSRDFLGAGIDLQYQWYVTRAELKSPDRNFKHTQQMWAKQVYLMLILEGAGNTSMVIKPYYIFPSKEYNAQPLQDFIEANGNTDKNKWNRFGVSVMFYNGAQ
jgi:hypothetical protein